jgi:hypothetical protein
VRRLISDDGRPGERASCSNFVEGLRRRPVVVIHRSAPRPCRDVIARDAHSDSWPWSARGARRVRRPKGWRRGRRPQGAGFPQRRCAVSATQCGSRQRRRSPPSHREPPSLAATRSAPTNLPHWSSRSCCHGRNARRVAPRRGGTGFEGERQKRHDSRWALFWKCFTALWPAQAMVEDSMLRSSSVRSPHPCSLHGA